MFKNKRLNLSTLHFSQIHCVVDVIGKDSTLQKTGFLLMMMTIMMLLLMMKMVMMIMMMILLQKNLCKVAAS